MKEMKDVAIVKDTANFLNRVVRERGLDVDTGVIRTVLDGGGGSFKVMASVFDGASDPEVTFSMIETPSELNTGVNRLLPLAVVENCPERHHNLCQILEQLRLQEVEGLFIVGDLKLYNIMLGLSAHGSKCSCAYCLGVLI